MGEKATVNRVAKERTRKLNEERKKKEKKLEIGRMLGILMMFWALCFIFLLFGTRNYVYADELETTEGEVITQSDELKSDLNEITEKLDKIEEKTQTTLDELKTSSELKEDIKAQAEEIAEIKATLETRNATNPDDTGPLYTSGNYFGINMNLPTYLYKMTTTQEQDIYFLSNSPNVQISEINNGKFQLIGLYYSNGLQQFGTGYKTREDAIRYTNKIIEYVQKNNLGSVYAVNLYTGQGREQPILFRAAGLDGGNTHNELGLQTGYIDSGTYNGRTYTQDTPYKVISCELIEILNEEVREENVLTPYLMILIALGLIIVFRRK